MSTRGTRQLIFGLLGLIAFANLRCGNGFTQTNFENGGASNLTSLLPGGGGGGGGGGKTAGQIAFESRVLPLLQSNCNSCHSEPRLGGVGPLTIYQYSAMRTKLGNGSSATNNELVNKIQNIINHGGANRCSGGITASPCKEITEWWASEFSGGGSTGGAYLGSLDTVDATGNVAGWASDPANPNAKISVLLYVNDTGSGLGTLVGTVLANQPGVGTGPSFGHSFTFTLPDAYRNGTSHRLYAYAVAAQSGNLLSNAPKTYTAYAPRAAGMNYFNNTVKPLMSRCMSCHNVDYNIQYYSLLSPAPSQGGTATNNLLINKPSAAVNHGGGNVCGGQNGSPCREFQEWWRLEFQ